MPKEYAVSRTIDAPAQVVWNLLTDAATYSDWNPAVVSIRGPIELGKTIELVSIVSPKRAFKLNVTELQAPSRMVWSDAMPLGLFTGTLTYSLTEHGPRTEFSMREVFSGPLPGLITKSIPDMTDSFNQFADGLETAAEAAN